MWHKTKDLVKHRNRKSDERDKKGHIVLVSKLYIVPYFVMWEFIDKYRIYKSYQIVKATLYYNVLMCYLRQVLDLSNNINYIHCSDRSNCAFDWTTKRWSFFFFFFDQIKKEDEVIKEVWEDIKDLK